MDLAYEYLQNDAQDRGQAEASGGSKSEPPPSLNDDIQDAYKAISSSAWGIKIGGFLGTVVKQGESVYNQAQKELAEVGGDASKGLTDLRESIMSRTRSLTINTVQAQESAPADDHQSTPTRSVGSSAQDAEYQPDSVLSRLRLEAAKRLKDLQRAEDAADEALLRFGTNVRDFLRDAVSVAPPEDSVPGDSTVLFESKDAQGRRVVHASRFEAQLHVIHSSVDRFTEEPSGAEFEAWANDFHVETRTEAISSDLAKYPDLRDTMEQLVPDQVPYADFWKRYYFLRHGLETAESRRRDLLKAASADDEVAWDDDSDEEPASTEAIKGKATSATSSTTLQPLAQPEAQPKAQPQPRSAEARKSNDEKSVADSEASYDVVGAASGKTSQAPSSPKEGKRADDSDDDWE